MRKERDAREDHESERGGESRSRKAGLKVLQARTAQLKKDQMQLEAAMEAHLAHDLSALRERRQIEWLAQKETLDSNIRKVKDELRQSDTELQEHKALLARKPKPKSTKASCPKPKSTKARRTGASDQTSISERGRKRRPSEDESDGGTDDIGANVKVNTSANNAHDKRTAEVRRLHLHQSRSLCMLGTHGSGFVLSVTSTAKSTARKTEKLVGGFSRGCHRTTMIRPCGKCCTTTKTLRTWRNLKRPTRSKRI